MTDQIEPIVIDLGKGSKKRLKQLKRGRASKLDRKVADAVAMAKQNFGPGSEGKEFVPLVVVYTRKASKKERKRAGSSGRLSDALNGTRVGELVGAGTRVGELVGAGTRVGELAAAGTRVFDEGRVFNRGRFVDGAVAGSGNQISPNFSIFRNR